MRSLFRREEKSTYTPPATVPTTAAPLVAKTAPENKTVEKNVPVETGQRKGKRKANRVLTAREQVIRNRKLAMATLAASLAFGGRWYIANQEPTYPMGEGVYQASIAPPWGKMKQPNAATFYAAASDALNLDDVYRVNGIPQSVWIMDEPVSVQKPIVERAQPAFALLRQGMKYPYIPDQQTNFFKSNPITETGFARPMEDFIVMRETARLLAAEANVRASEGNIAGALESSLDTIRYGIDNGQGHTLVAGMIGVLIEKIGAKEGIKHVAGLSASDSRAGAKRLATMLDRERTFAQMMTVDRDSAYEVVKDMYKHGSVEGLVGDSITGNAAELIYQAGILYYTKQGTVNDIASYFDTILQRAKMPYQESVRLNPIERPKNPVLQIITPNVERALSQTVSCSMYNRVLLAQLAVQAYRGEHGGAAPVSLSVLTSGNNPYLHSVPIDPFSMSGTDPLRYKAGTGTVYSVGKNGVDNGNAQDDNDELFEK